MSLLSVAGGVESGAESSRVGAREAASRPGATGRGAGADTGGAPETEGTRTEPGIIVSLFTEL